MSDRACPRLLGSPVSHFGRGLCPRGSASTPEAEPCKDAAPGVFQIYIDEIYTDLSESSGGRQVFLIGLQEHMGSDLVDWLKDFGTILDLSRIQAPAVDIAGKERHCHAVYVTFAVHEEAESVLRALMMSGKDVKGSWSASEKMSERKGVLLSLARRLKSIQAQLGFHELFLGGDSWPWNASDIAEILGRSPYQGALHIVGRADLSQDMLIRSLREAVADAHQQPCTEPHLEPGVYLATSEDAVVILPSNHGGA